MLEKYPETEINLIFQGVTTDPLQVIGQSIFENLDQGI